MSCGGGHLGFPIGIKNRNFVEDLQMIIHGQLVSEEKRFETFYVHWMVLCKVYVFCSDGRWQLQQVLI
jgi:hypothetical protein